MRASASRLVVVVALCSLASGCCTSLRRAIEINAELQEQNTSRAEPAMRSAAQRQGATLLLDQPRQLGFAPLCSATQDSALPAGGYCVRVPQSGIGARGQLGDVYQLLDHEGKRRIAVTIGEAHSWARLAKRGETLFLLTPAVTFQQVDHRVQCDCQGGPVIDSMSDYVNLGLAFVLDLPTPQIQPIMVPVVNDYVAWDCKRIAVRNDHVPHPAVARAHLNDPARSLRQSALIRSFRCVP